MDDRGHEFRVGMMAVAALAATVFMIFRFSEVGNRWKSGTRISVVMADATGINPETPVRMSGIRIGQVESLKLIADGRGVQVALLIHEGFTFRKDSRAQVSRSLLGDGVLEILPATEGAAIANGDRIIGQPTTDPMQAIARLEQRVATTLESFESTGREWTQLGNNLNRLLEGSGRDGVTTIERSALALEQFTRTMKTAETTLASAGRLIDDPRYQQQLQATLTALPNLLNETRTTLRNVNAVLQQVDSTVGNLNAATAPLARNSEAMVARLGGSLKNIETLTAELATVSQLMNANDGTIKKMLTDPTMYRNLNATAGSMAVLLENLKPVVADLQVFSDKVARHPELLGVRGVVRGSSGTKDGVTPAGYESRP